MSEKRSVHADLRVDGRGWGKWLVLIGVALLAWVIGLLAARPWLHPDNAGQKEPRELALPELPLPNVAPGLDPKYVASVEEAQEVAHRLVQSFPTDARAAAAMAILHYLAHDEAGEAACWQRCLDLDRGFSQAYRCLAERARDMGEYARAEALLREAIVVDPKAPEFHDLLATALLDQGKLEEAVEVLENHATINPRSVTTHILLGQAYLQLKENEKARSRFETALLLYPTSTRAYHGLAQACANLGLKEDADRYRAEFVRLKAIEDRGRQESQRDMTDDRVVPRCVADILTTAGRVYLAHDRAKDAEEHLLRAATLDPGDSECREALSSLYDQQGRLEEALRMVEELKELEPGSVTHRRNLGILQARLGRFDAAEEAFRELCALAPEQAVGYAGLAELSLRTGKEPSEAKTLALKAVRLEPTAWNYFILAAVCEKNGDRSGARSALEQAMRLDPGNPRYQAMYESVREKP